MAFMSPLWKSEWNFVGLKLRNADFIKQNNILNVASDLLGNDAKIMFDIVPQYAKNSCIYKTSLRVLSNAQVLCNYRYLCYISS